MSKPYHLAIPRDRRDQVLLF